MVIGDGSKLEVEASDESGSDLIELPIMIRGYLAAAYYESGLERCWINQQGFTWTTLKARMW